MEVHNPSADISLGFQVKGDEKETDDCCYKRLINRRVENGYLNEVYSSSSRPRRGAVVSNWSGVARVLSKRSLTKPNDSNTRSSKGTETVHVEDSDITADDKRELPNGSDWPILNGSRRMNLRITVERCKSRLLNGEAATNQCQDADEPGEHSEEDTCAEKNNRETSIGLCNFTVDGKISVDSLSFRPKDSCKLSELVESCNAKALAANGSSCKCKVFQTTKKYRNNAPGCDALPRADYQEVIYGSGLHTTNSPVGSEASGLVEDEVLGSAVTDTAFASNPVRLKPECEVSKPGVVSVGESFRTDNNNCLAVCSQLPLNGLIAKKLRGNEFACKETLAGTNGCVAEPRCGVVSSIEAKEHPCCTFKSICNEINDFDSVTTQSRVCREDSKQQNLFLKDIEKDAVKDVVSKQDCREIVTNGKSARSGRSTKVGGGTGKDANCDCLCKWVNCNALLGDAVELKTHVKEMHVKTMAASDLFFCFWKGCKVYNKPSSSYNWLVKHVNTHVGIRPFQCVIEPCDLSFASHSALVRHVQSHFNERSKYYKKTKSFSKESSESPSARCKEDETVSSSESTSSKDSRKRRLKFFMTRARPGTPYDTNDGFDRDSMDYVKKKLVGIDSSNNQLNGNHNVLQPLGRRTSDRGEVQYLMTSGHDRRQCKWHDEKDVLLDGLLQFPFSKLSCGQREKMYKGLFGTQVNRHRRKAKKSSVKL